MPISIEVIAADALTFAPTSGLPSDPVTVSVSVFLCRAFGEVGVITALTDETEIGTAGPVKADTAGVPTGAAAEAREVCGLGVGALLGMSIPGIEL